MAKTKIKLPTHIHLYQRIDLTPKWRQKLPQDHRHWKPGYIVLSCTKPACNHHTALNKAIGKLCECNRCHEPMILDKETVTHAKPHCQECIKRKSSVEIDMLKDLVEDKL